MASLADYTSAIESSRAARASVQWARALALGGGTLEALEIFKASVGAQSPAFQAYEKAAMAAFTSTGDPALAFARLNTEFLAIVVRGTVLGRMTGTVPVVPQTLTPIATSEVVADFVAERSPAPAVKFDVDQAAFLGRLKLALLLGITRDLLRVTDERVVTLLERHLVRAIRRGEDSVLLSAAAAVAGERPAGLLEGISASGAGSPSSFDADLIALWGDVRNGDPERPVFVTSARGALYLGTARNPDGSPAFPNVSLVGTGSILGVPLLISPAAEDRLILIDAASVGVADGGLVIDASQQAAVEMNTTPTGDASSTVSSAFQSNLSFIRVTRFIDWTLAHADGAGFINLPIE